MDTNAKTEFNKVILSKGIVKCATITIEIVDMKDDYTFERNQISADLKINYSQKELEDFLNQIDVMYYSGYGGQELYGTVWMTDGTWFTRWEYDGSEGWEHHVVPKIPENLI